MVIELKTGNGFRGALSYAQKEHAKNLLSEQKPEIIERNNVYGDTRKMSQQMRFVANGNTRGKVPVMHVIVSFDRKESITPFQQQIAVKAVLKEMGVTEDKNQYIIVKHNDTDHPHFHVILNKTDLDGNNLKISVAPDNGQKREQYVKKHLIAIADKIEREHGLKLTEGRTIFYDPTQKFGFRYATEEEKEREKSKSRDKKATISGTNDKLVYEKSRIKSRLEEVLNDRSVTTPEQLEERMQAENIEVKFTRQKAGISGISFKKDNISIKGSAIDAKWSRIDRALTENAILAKEKDLLAYIKANSPKNAFAVHVVDQAIREKMPEINPNENPWITWEKNQDHEKLYHELYNYSERIIASQQEEIDEEKIRKRGRRR